MTFLVQGETQQQHIGRAPSVAVAKARNVRERRTHVLGRALHLAKRQQLVGAASVSSMVPPVLADTRVWTYASVGEAMGGGDAEPRHERQLKAWTTTQ